MNQYEFEQKIKGYLKEDGRSQASIARKLGYSPDTFNKWVHGVNRMPDTMIVAFCELLRLSDEQQAELLGLAGYVVPTRYLKAAASDLLTMPGIVFATQITANGQALNPGTVFPAHISDLYAVFLPDKTPPGTNVDVSNPIANTYYAYLRVRDDSTTSRFGWRWYYDGEVVNEYQTDITPGNVIWLQRFGYGKGGIFDGDPLGSGTYRIAILLGGNPAISSELTITANV